MHKHANAIAETCINMHEAGDKLNRSFNFLTKNTFMKPHSHNEKGMVEEIRLIKGKIKISKS